MAETFSYAWTKQILKSPFVYKTRSHEMILYYVRKHEIIKFAVSSSLVNSYNPRLSVLANIPRLIWAKFIPQHAIFRHRHR